MSRIWKECQDWRPWEASVRSRLHSLRQQKYSAKSFRIHSSVNDLVCGPSLPLGLGVPNDALRPSPPSQRIKVHNNLFSWLECLYCFSPCPLRSPPPPSCVFPPSRAFVSFYQLQPRPMHRQFCLSVGAEVKMQREKQKKTPQMTIEVKDKIR